MRIGHVVGALGFLARANTPVGAEVGGEIVTFAVEGLLALGAADAGVVVVDGALGCFADAEEAEEASGGVLGGG